MTTIRRAYQGLHSLCRIHRNYAGCITCSVGSSSKQACEQFFSATAWFQWLSRYGNNTGLHSEQRMSLAEFDPLRHMNIERPDTVTRVTDCADRTSSLGDNFAAVSVCDVVPLPNNTLHTSPSWDSLLDTVVVSPEVSREPTETTKNQLVLASDTEDSEDFKPVSLKELFLRQCVAKKESEYTEVKKFTLFCGSWNVNSKSPPESLNSWLLVDDQPPDVYAIGFQELDTSKEAFVFMESPKEAEWLTAVSSCLNSRAPYMKVKSIRLVGLLLVVFVNENYSKYVSRTGAASVATGVMKVLGDKGAVSVRLKFHNTSLCFINSHLAAHQAETERRNMDYNTIISKMKFRGFDPKPAILDHDLVFWFGDLNYRIDLPIDCVKSYIKKRSFPILFQSDQLYQQMKNAIAFQGFNEGAINFDPTFKFDPGTDTYDTSEKQRIPAWCDRILWSGSGVEQRRYDSHPSRKESDHKPISSLFNIDIKVINPKKYKLVYEDVMQKLDKVENEYSLHGKTKCVSADVQLIEAQPHMVTVGSVPQERPSSLIQVGQAQDGGWLVMVPKEIRKFVDLLYKNGSNKPQCLEAGPSTPDIHQR